MSCPSARLNPNADGRWMRCIFCEQEECGTLPIFLSDVKARHDKMVGLVETMRGSYIVASKDSYIVGGQNG